MKVERIEFSAVKRRGSVILIAMIVITILSVIGGSILNLALQSHALSIRNNKRLEAQAIAESELDVVYHKWQTLLKQAVSPASVPNAMSSWVKVSTSPDDLFNGDSHTPYINQNGNWSVQRTLSYSGEWPGRSPKDPTKTSTVAYFTAGVVVSGTGPDNTGIEFRLGRRFARFNTSIFQSAIFYQGDLELAPGTDMDILGPVTANGSIYAGANQWKILRFHDLVTYGEKFNSSIEGKESNGARRRHPLSPIPSNKFLREPFFTDPNEQNPDLINAARARLLRRMSEKENFLGGLNANEIKTSLPTIFPTENDVYRAVVEPPPPTTIGPGGQVVSGDYPLLAEKRLYNQAGLRILIDGNGTMTIGTKTETDAYTNNIAFSGVVNSVRKTVYDQREQKNVKVTTIDVANLLTAIRSVPALNTSFNGVVYISDANTSDGAIRLVNGETLPIAGLSIATNNGLYVQGNYNTTLIDGRHPSASLIADAVTVLSSGWNDANSANAISERVADQDLTVVAGILTGNTPTSAAGNSGGAHNLVRLMENWNGKRVTLKGSIGQLFASKYFNGRFPQTLGTVYGIPGVRVMEFDRNIAIFAPPGAPQTTEYSRGEMITAVN